MWRPIEVAAAVLVCFCPANPAVADGTAASVNFLALGDWGGVGQVGIPVVSNWLFPTHQKDVAAGMARVAKEQDSQFVVALGDNFYYNGIGGFANAYANPYARVQETFEDVYRDLGPMKWYVIAGNHDYYGDVSDQVQYTYFSRLKAQTDVNHTHRWEFPSLWHKQSFSADSVTVDLILVDTVLLVEPYYPIRFSTWRRGKVKAGLEQWEWLKLSLQQSTADYVLVAGHFPVFSQGLHGPTTELLQNLKPLLEQFGAHYISAHDHSMMHFQQQELPGVNYIVTGVGNMCCTHQGDHEGDENVPLLWHMFYEDNFQGAVKGGFVSFQATATAMRVQYHDHAGNVLFEPAQPMHPRLTGLWQPDNGMASNSDNTQVKRDASEWLGCCT